MNFERIDSHEIRRIIQGSHTIIFVCSRCHKVKEIVTIGQVLELKDHLVREIMES